MKVVIAVPAEALTPHSVTAAPYYSVVVVAVGKTKWTSESAVTIIAYIPEVLPVAVIGKSNVAKLKVWAAAFFPLQKKHSYVKVAASVVNTVGNANLKQSVDSSYIFVKWLPNK